MTNRVPFIITLRGVTVLSNGQPVSVDRSEGAVYDRVVNILKNPDVYLDGELDATLRDRAEALRLAIQRQNIEGVVVENGEVRYNGKIIHSTLSERMLTMLDEGFNLTPMKRFLEKLLQNPSFRAVDGLYDFLEYGNMPITEDGDFLAYKAIRGDWKDIHSGTFSNVIGTVVEVPRNEVDEDPDQTCSHGLHVCSHEYLPNFSHADGHVVIVKINPKDVVAVPRDYNNTKMRVCRYEVIDEVEGWYANRRDTLSEVSVWGLGDDDDDDDCDDADWDGGDGYWYDGVWYPS